MTPTVPTATFLDIPGTVVVSRAQMCLKTLTSFSYCYSNICVELLFVAAHITSSNNFNLKVHMTGNMICGGWFDVVKGRSLALFPL